MTLISHAQIRDIKILVNPIIRNISRLGNWFRYSVVRFGSLILFCCVVEFHSTVLCLLYSVLLYFKFVALPARTSTAVLRPEVYPLHTCWLTTGVRAGSR
jgi:hypothetical protein